MNADISNFMINTPNKRRDNRLSEHSINVLSSKSQLNNCEMKKALKFNKSSPGFNKVLRI